MRACRACASRGLLLASLAAHLDRGVDRRTGGRAKDVLALGDVSLVAAMSPDDGVERLRRARSDEAHEQLEARLAGAGCWSTCMHRDGFPPSLAALEAGAPRALFAAGDAHVLGRLRPECSVTVVGSRRAGAYGRDVAHELSRLLASSGITVISGLALGVDSAAHEGALAGAGETVAVLGTGAERSYPRSRRHLYERIRTQGLVLSELPPGAPTFRWMFPARNRVMAALAGITVVVEAAERSGSLITAEMALDAGRQVGAVPGPVTSWRSSGTNKLLADGAAVVRDAQDVLDLLLGPGQEMVREFGPPLDPGDLPVLGAIESGASSADAVSAVTGIGFRAALGALGRLERSGYIKGDATGSYTRTTRVPPGRGRDAMPSTIAR